MRITMLTASVLLMAMQAAPTPPAAPAKEPLKLDEALLAPKPAANERADQAETPRDFDAAAFRAAIRKSESAMGAKDWAGAEGALQEALALKPDSKEAAYNLGLAQYMQGKFKDAAKRFEESAAGASSIKDARASADLAARSMYNEGRARYGELLDMLEKAPPAAATPGAPQTQAPLPPEQLKEAIKLAQNSLTHFKDAAIANPGDQDSAANAETSLQLLKQLQKLEQQQQQQQNQDQQKQDQKKDQQKQDQQQKQDKSQDSKDPQSEQKEQQKSEDQKQQEQEQQRQQQQKNESSKSQGDESKQSQQQSDSKQQSEQSQDKQQQQQQQQSKPQDSPDQKNDPQRQQQKDPKQDQQKQDQKKDQSKQDQPMPDPKDGKQEDSKDQNGQPQQPNEAQTAEGKPGEQKAPSMQQAKADKLLQLVRDKEKARNAERQTAKGQIRPTPVDRDW